MKTFNLILIALGAAILAALSPFTLPLAVIPLTLQTLAVGLIATLYHPREAFGAILLYCLLGFMGLPIFGGGASGLAVLFSPNGGYLIAFLLVGTLIAWLLTFVHYKFLPTLVINLMGHLVILLAGSLWIKYYLGVSWIAAFTAGFLPFVIVELIKAFLATIIGLALRRPLARINNYFR